MSFSMAAPFLSLILYWAPTACRLQCMLRTLRVAGCLQLRSVVIQLPPAAPLEELDLANCRCSRVDRVLGAGSGCSGAALRRARFDVLPWPCPVIVPRLASCILSPGLAMWACRQLQEVVLVAAQLRQLTLSHCGVLASLTLKCRQAQGGGCLPVAALPAPAEGAVLGYGSGQGQRGRQPACLAQQHAAALDRGRALHAVLPQVAGGAALRQLHPAAGAGARV